MKEGLKIDQTNFFDTVVKNDFCIGCGLCACEKNSPFSIGLNEFGKYKAFIKENSKKNLENIRLKKDEISEICPVYNTSLNEDIISNKIFKGMNKDKVIGHYIKLYAGFAIEDKFRERGSSGGLTSWLLCNLLKSNKIEGVIHVKPCFPTNGSKVLFKYSISYNSKEINNGSKSRYYPMELSQVIISIRKENKKYAFVGIPCMIKSMRMLAMKDPVINTNIKYYIGLVCGHLKSVKYTEFIGIQLGFDPKDIFYIDYRKKTKFGSANKYGVRIVGKKDGKLTSKFKLMKDLYCTRWEYGFFKYKYCDFCDDIFSECADITFGDAWLPRYKNNVEGTNIIIVRNKELNEIIKKSNIEGRIYLDKLEKKIIYDSQAGGIRNKRAALQYRLYLMDKLGKWRPQKRVFPSNNHISYIRKKIYFMRFYISLLSNRSYLNLEGRNKYNSAKFFKKNMSIYLILYNFLIYLEKIKNKIIRSIRNLI